MQKLKIITGFTPKKTPSKPIAPNFDFNFGLSSNDKKDKQEESQKSSPKRLSTNKKDFLIQQIKTIANYFQISQKRVMGKKCSKMS